LTFLAEQGRPVCARTLRLEPLKVGPALPRDVPPAQLRRLQQEIETEAAADPGRRQRLGVLDRAWFLLMLHSGLRVGEIRRLQLPDLELEAQRVRLEQAKGLKDRVVPLSAATVDALRDYLAVRGPAPGEHVFIHRHQPLSPSYCYERLRTYGERCGVLVTPHQLRHSCATLLLNAGAPILTVQTILGHKHIDTTLGYARLYDGTLAADYYRAMGEVESRLALGEDTEAPPPSSGELLALVDALNSGTLNNAQRETVQMLRAAILALEETRMAAEEV
ncbi:MAG: site-specific integrase, partial [Chloroflexi bacterium]|nr:site-specific integrase [Chloroflexota bacterium]